MAHSLFNTLQNFNPVSGKTGKFYCLPQLEKEGIGAISRLPVSISFLLESVLRNYDDTKITEQNVLALANWQPNAERMDQKPKTSRGLKKESFHSRMSHLLFIVRTGKPKKRLSPCVWRRPLRLNTICMAVFFPMFSGS